MLINWYYELDKTYPYQMDASSNSLSMNVHIDILISVHLNGYGMNVGVELGKKSQTPGAIDIGEFF